jgi:transposase
MHLVHNTIPGKCWQEKGLANTVVFSSNTGRRRISVIGAIDAMTKKFSGLITEENCNKEAIKVQLDIIRKNYPDKKPIILFWDNAKYQRAYDTQDYAKTLDITLIFIPPYSPNLNLIERVWKFFKNKLRNKYREKFQEFYEASIEICAQLDKDYLPEVSNLINHKFHILM